MPDLEQILSEAPKNAVIQKALMTAYAKLEEYDRVLCSVSGGSDSDIMMDILERVKPEGKEIIYAWFDTGMEYEATKRHLPELEQKYGVEIHREKAVIPVAEGCRKYGVPFLSKRASVYIGRLQSHGFGFDEQEARIEKARSSAMWWDNKWDSININKFAFLKEFMMKNHPLFRISDKCCEGAKKKTGNKSDEKYKPDVKCIGIRKAEGGVRSQVYKTAFQVPHKTNAHNTVHCSSFLTKIRRRTRPTTESDTPIATKFGE